MKQNKLKHSHIYLTLFICTLLLIIVIPDIRAQENQNSISNPVAPPPSTRQKVIEVKTQYKLKHINRPSISFQEKAFNLGLVYTAQWSYYVIGQNQNIRENGSFENWYTNIPKLHFDKDSYDYNLILHTMTGSYYYLFFRSRGYTKHSSLRWSILSHLLFEFTIETITEPPSIQDIYQTPVLGTLVGMIVEHTSLYLLNSDYAVLRFFGYVLNPFTLFGFSYYEMQPVTYVSPEIVSYGFTFSF